MKDFEMRYVGSHVEVYSGSGAFLFSADTVREAMEEVAGHEAAHVRRRCHSHRHPADPAALWSVRLINKR